MTASNRASQEPDVSLHLGVHKTATTFIQKNLDLHRLDLAEKGVTLILPPNLRDKNPKKTSDAVDAERIETEADTKSTGDSRLANALHEARTSVVERVVISEEALIGSCRNNLARAQLYSSLRDRLAALPSALNDPKVTVFLSIRSYAEFFSSNVTTAARRGGLFDPLSLKLSLIRMRRTWVNVVADIVSVLPRAKLKIWRYEDFGLIEDRVFKEITGHHLTTNGQRQFRTLSQPAMEKIYLTFGTSPRPPLSKQFMRNLMEEFPISKENPPFSLWSEPEKTLLRNAYNEDWQIICANSANSNIVILK